MLCVGVLCVGALCVGGALTHLTAQRHTDTLALLSGRTLGLVLLVPSLGGVDQFDHFPLILLLGDRVLLSAFLTLTAAAAVVLSAAVATTAAAATLVVQA